MAQRPQRPCRATGCRALHRNANGYCDAHAELAATWGGARRGTSAERGYGSTWRRLRQQILRRDGWRCRCAECTAAGRVRNATEVDHVVPKARGGTDDPSNLCAINTECHAAKTRREAAEGARLRRGVSGPGGS